MRARAFSLVEMLTALSIIVVLVAVLSPVLGRIKDHVQVRASLDRLRQMSLATTMYRHDWGDGSDYSSPTGLSLPPYGTVYGTFMGLGKDFFRSPCGYKDAIETNLSRLSYGYAPTPYPVYLEHLAERQEGALLFSDPHCNPDHTAWLSRFYKKQGLSVTLGGRLHRVYKAGDPGLPDWWVTP